MLFPDLSLTRRLELHEAWSSREHARTQAQLYPETGATALPVGEGVAIFCGRKAPISRVFGLGLSGPVSPAELDEIERFYRDRGRDVHLCLSPLADPALFRLLGERGYSLRDFMNVYVREIDSADLALPPAPGLEVRVATVAQARAWFTQSGADGDWAEPDGVSFMAVRCVQKAGARLYLAWRDGQALGGGALELHDGVAALMAAGTLPRYRRQGVHTALMRARLAAAAKAGAGLAMVHTEPGTPSQRNVLRAGFQLAYTVVGLVGPAARAPGAQPEHGPPEDLR